MFFHACVFFAVRYALDMTKKKQALTGFTSVKIQQSTLDRLHDLADHVEKTTGLRPTIGSLAARCLGDGIDTLRARPSLALDCSPKAGDK